MLYSPTTSIAKRTVLGSREGRDSNCAKKSFVSLMYDGRDCTTGFKMQSTKALILSVGARMELTIGLPGGASVFLCILGKV